MTDDLAVLDMSVLDELRASVGGDEAFIRDVVETYLAEGPQYMEQVAAAVASVNAFAFRAGSADAALLTTLAPGAYTVQVTGGTASLDGTGGALVEIYEILQPGEAPGARRLVNLSARGPVASGAPLIAGFVINGTAPQRAARRHYACRSITYEIDSNSAARATVSGKASSVFSASAAYRSPTFLA